MTEALLCNHPDGWTERKLLDLLRLHYDDSAPRINRPSTRHYMEHVRNDAAMYAKRTIDALVMHTYPSKGLALHAHEVKCSRSDWLRELKNPEKAEAWTSLVEFMWLVTPENVARESELPEKWGWLAPSANHGYLITKKHAKPLRPVVKYSGGWGDGAKVRPEPLDRGLVVAMLRAMTTTAHNKRPIGQTEGSFR